MLKRILLILLASSVSSLSFAVERVISLAPSSTELAYAAGLGDKLIAVSESSDYPEEAQKLEKVATFSSINIERIISLNPDLIIAWQEGSNFKDLNQLKALGFKIVYTDSKMLTDIPDSIEKLSQYSDTPETGIQNAQAFRNKLSALKKQYSSDRKITYFYQISSKPLYTVTQNNWPSEIFELCGGENIFKNAPGTYPKVSLEQVLAKAPQVIFTSAHAVQSTEQWMMWKDQVPAVAQNQIWSLNADWLNRPTPRSLKAVEEVCRYLEKARN